MLQTCLEELLKSWIWWDGLNQDVTLSCKQQGETQASHVDFKCPKALVLKIRGLVAPAIKRGVRSHHGLAFQPVQRGFRALWQILWDLSMIQESKVSPSTSPALFWLPGLLANRETSGFSSSLYWYKEFAVAPQFPLLFPSMCFAFSALRAHSQMLTCFTLQPGGD